MNWGEVWQYVILNKNGLYQGMPDLLLIILGSITVVGLLFVFFSRGVKQKGRAFAMILLIAYVILVFCTTVFLRATHAHKPFDFHLLWSYRAFLAGKNAVMAEKIMNLVLFVPVGLLSGIVLRNTKWYYVILSSFILSVIIEILQFVLNRGYAEVDDVFHNTIGAILGFGLFCSFEWMYKKILKLIPNHDNNTSHT